MKVRNEGINQGCRWMEEFGDGQVQAGDEKTSGNQGKRDEDRVEHQSRGQVFEWGAGREVRGGKKWRGGCESGGIRRVGDGEIGKKMGKGEKELT